jgi:hypothetical protein
MARLTTPEALHDESQLWIVHGSSPRHDVPAHGRVGVGVARPAGRGGNPRRLVRARLEDDADPAAVREADEALLADAALDGFDTTLPQETRIRRRRQGATVARARRDESDPEERYRNSAVPLNT